MSKINLGRMLQINAMATDTISFKIPKILELLGMDVTDQEYLDEMIENYGNDFCDWLEDYVEQALPTYEGKLPDAIVDDDEVRNFVYDLMMNFYIARMLIIELNSPYGEPDVKGD
jgi:hypothetical protein